MTAFCLRVDVFISKIGMKISCRRTSISFCAPDSSIHDETISIRNTYLELGTHACENPPENLHTDVEHLRYRADSIPTQTKAEILVYGLHKSGSFVT